jgi:hypothetical protein
MRYRKLGLLLGLALIAVAAVGTASASSQSSAPVLPDSSLNPLSATIGGASPLATTKTVAHWSGTETNPSNGVTYGYNMVGSNPNSCSGAGCSTTITADITPVIVNIDGLTFDPTASIQGGNSALQGVEASPIFQGNDYGSTTAASVEGGVAPYPDPVKGPGGLLSQNDAGNLLQLEDATMRAQFNQTGSSPYHLMLNPVVHPAVTIDVPSGAGTLLQSGRGVIFADVNIQWWETRIQNLNTLLGYNDPTHLAIYLTDNVVNFIGTNPGNCCVIGFHGAAEVPSHTDNGPQNGKGNQPVQTYAWASWTSPGFFARPNGGRDWALQDIHALSHEISEWADDPFINNFVQPWLTPTAPQYGCSNLLETGDPVVAIGFAMGTNTTEQGPNPNGSQSADGSYHPEDEVFLPWFMRTSPNTISEPTQSPSTNIGRYTLMGSLNPYAGFQAPATGC